MQRVELHAGGTTDHKRKAAMQRPPIERGRDDLPTGTRVEVRIRFQGSWSNGFEVARVTDGGYWLRRESDGYLLPTSFVADDVRRRS